MYIVFAIPRQGMRSWDMDLIDTASQNNVPIHRALQGDRGLLVVSLFGRLLPLKVNLKVQKLSKSK